MYREYFRGYGGHIPFKYEVFGKTVNETNRIIKEKLMKEPDYSQTYKPAINKDYTYYQNDYFNENFAKNYDLEEDQIYGMRSKQARTWIDGHKHQLYPEHIPGYTGKITGIEPSGKKGSNIIGSSYAKNTAVAIKGTYNKDIDIPIKERYTSTQKDSYTVPKMRADDDMHCLLRDNPLIEEEKRAREYFDKLERKEHIPEIEKAEENMSEAFKNSIKIKRDGPTLPYIVGYKGFRPGVVSNNYYGKNFREIALVTGKQIQ